jgi:uncharacterized protein YjdB
MKKFMRTFVVASGMAMLLGMSSEAAVSSVKIAEPVQNRIVKSHKYHKTVPCYHVRIGKGANNTVTLKPIVATTGTTSKAVTFKSSNKAVATVTSNGKVHFKKPGVARITVTSKANPKKTATVRFQVNKIKKQISSMKASISRITMSVGQVKRVKVTYKPKDASVTKINYVSKKPSVVTFKDGVLKARKPGYTYVKAKAADGSGEYVKIVVKVVAPKKSEVNTDKLDQLDGKPVTLNIDGGVSFSKPAEAQKTMNSLVSEIVSNNYIPESMKTTRFADGTVVTLGTEGIKFVDKNGKDITADLFSGKKEFDTVEIQDQVNAASVTKLITGLGRATKNLETSYKFAGKMSLKQGNEKIVLTNVVVNKGAVRFNCDGKRGSVIFTADGQVRFGNCDKVAKYVSNVTGGIIG